jgi:TfoX/Sxy family transcriptional regulator of competence genes
MVASASFAEFLREHLAPLGHLTMRRMFGKTGVFCDRVMLGMVRDDTLYFRVDDENREMLKEAQAFSPLDYEKKGETINLSFWRAPDRLFDEPDELLSWARSALGAARRVAASRANGPIIAAEERDESRRRNRSARKESNRAFAIKAEIRDPRAKSFTFAAQKTMYGGKSIAEGDTVYVFHSENEGGQGLVARGIVTSAKPIPRMPGVARQTPRVRISVKRTALAKRPLGRKELKHLNNWKDGQPETELNFKFYRQATNKICGVSEEAAEYLDKFF